MVREQIIKLALDEPALSPRELAVAAASAGKGGSVARRRSYLHWTMAAWSPSCRPASLRRWADLTVTGLAKFLPYGDGFSAKFDTSRRRDLLH